MVTAQKMESILVYAGENKPKIQLTKIKSVPRIEEVIKYMQQTQDIFQLQLNAVETITGNLKIKSICQNDDVEDCGKPFYILEYCEEDGTYSLWKSPLDWKLSSAIAMLYGENSSKELPDAIAETLVDPDQRSVVLKLLREFNIRDDRQRIDWSHVADDLQLFFKNFNKENVQNPMSEAAYQKQAPLFELNQLKTVLALSLLKSMVDSNKSELKNVLLSYDKKVHGSSIIERSPMSSPESFVKSATPVPAGSDYTHAPSTQLQSNFHDFFQSCLLYTSRCV